MCVCVCAGAHLCSFCVCMLLSCCTNVCHSVDRCMCVCVSFGNFVVIRVSCAVVCGCFGRMCVCTYVLTTIGHSVSVESNDTLEYVLCDHVEGFVWMEQHPKSHSHTRTHTDTQSRRHTHALTPAQTTSTHAHTSTTHTRTHTTHAHTRPHTSHTHTHAPADHTHTHTPTTHTHART